MGDDVLELVRRHWPIGSLHSQCVDFVPGRTAIPYSGPVWTEDEVAAAVRALLDGSWLTSGENVERFERMFSEVVGQPHSVMTNSGSSANLLMVAALRSERLFGFKDGEIITPAAAFPTTVAPIVQCGFTPRFVDIELDTLNLDLDAVEAAIGPQTRALMFAHVLGVPPDMDRVAKLCDQHGFVLLEDNCDALGSTWSGRPTGSFGWMSTCSFYPAHHLSTAEGGMVSTSGAAAAKVVRSLCWWGRDCWCVGDANLLPDGTCGHRFRNWLPGTPDLVVDHKYVFAEMGYNLKPLDLQGAIGLVQLGRLDQIHTARVRNFESYRDFFANYPDLFRVVTPDPRALPSWFGCPVTVVTDRFSKSELTRHLESHRIQTRNYFAGNLLEHPGYRHLGNAEAFPNATEALRSTFFLGVSPNLTRPQLDYVQNVIADFVASG